MEELLRGFPLIIEVPVAWGDMDAMQHVNNVACFRYSERARIVSHQHQKIAAEGEAVMVSFNYREQKKAPLPEETKRYIQTLETAAAG
ncbi:MAG TPA: hypothetical protein VNQ79_25850 [Blastocatellia bacterium]|nr:hypothetical protein [Blastocatellia bacterium]